MNKVAILLFMSILCCASCKTKQKLGTAVQNTESPKVVENIKKVCADSENNLAWLDATAEIDNKIKYRVASKYKLFAVDELKLRYAFESNFKKNKEFVISIPVYKDNSISCISFRLINSETISKEKQAEMGHFSFKGRNTANNLESGRFDFSNNGALRAYIHTENENYIMEPIELLGKRYYISFNKKDALSTKKDFEREN